MNMTNKKYVYYVTLEKSFLFFRWSTCLIRIQDCYMNSDMIQKIENKFDGVVTFFHLMEY